MRNVHPVMLVDIRLWRINQPAVKHGEQRLFESAFSNSRKFAARWGRELIIRIVEFSRRCLIPLLRNERDQIRPSIFRKTPRFESILRYYTRDIPLRGILRLLLETPWSMPGRKVRDSRESWPGTDPFRVMGKVDYRRDSFQFSTAARNFGKFLPLKKRYLFPLRTMEFSNELCIFFFLSFRFIPVKEKIE